MSSPITFSNFNSIDFSVILNAVMTQESQPLQALQARQSVLTQEGSAYTTLATKLGALETAASDLSTPDAVVQYSATVSDTSALTASTGSGAIPGRYEVVVKDLARAQVTASSTTVAADTVVATGGTITIGGVDVNVSESVTLRGLADLINANEKVGASASVVQASPGRYRLVLTGKDTGADAAFTIAFKDPNTGEDLLTGGVGVGFTDTNGDGTAGDSDLDNAVKATNATALVNQVEVTGASNTLNAAIPGVTLNLLQEDENKTIVVTVAQDNTALSAKINTFLSAYNGLILFAQSQVTDAATGKTGTIAQEPLLRQLRNTLRTVINGAYGSGTFTKLAEVGVGFSRTGGLTVDQKILNAALRDHASSVATLFAGDGTSGAFGAIQDAIATYTQTGGLVATAKTSLESQWNRLGSKINDMQARLALRRAALQREYAAADAIMTQLKAQSGTLASYGSSTSSTSSGLFTNTSG